jgi:hypothetical protein
MFVKANVLIQKHVIFAYYSFKKTLLPQNMLRKPLFALMLLALVSFALPAHAQKVIKPKPKASPLCMASFLGDDVYLKVTYGQPSKNGREIFGALVPYNKIWRTGANEATEFTTTKDIKFDKKTLKAGTYTLFSIPDEKKWTVIFNSTVGQWGAYKYEESKATNVLQVEVPVEIGEDEYEGFTIQFEQSKKGADMVLLWDKTRIAVPITFIKK